MPAFACSDPYLETAYWYRWYGLRLLTVDVCAGQLPYPCVFEGIGSFRSHITYSAQCHLRELSRQQDRTVARGTLLNFLAAQTRTTDERDEDGFLPGHLYLWRRDRGFYHASWGAAALQFYYLTDDPDFVRHWIVDPIIRHVIGIQPEPEPNGALVIDPLPFGLREFRIERVPVRSHLIDVSWSMVEGFLVRVDGKERLRLPEIRWVEIKLE